MYDAFARRIGAGCGQGNTRVAYQVLFLCRYRFVMLSSPKEYLHNCGSLQTDEIVCLGPHQTVDV